MPHIAKMTDRSKMPDLQHDAWNCIAVCAAVVFRTVCRTLCGTSAQVYVQFSFDASGMSIGDEVITVSISPQQQFGQLAWNVPNNTATATACPTSNTSQTANCTLTGYTFTKTSNQLTVFFTPTGDALGMFCRIGCNDFWSAAITSRATFFSYICGRMRRMGQFRCPQSVLEDCMPCKAAAYAEEWGAGWLAHPSQSLQSSQTQYWPGRGGGGRLRGS